MKFIAEKAALLRVTSIVCPRAGRNIPILESALIVATKGGVTITTTDMDMRIEGRAKAEVSKAGSVCVDANVLNDVISMAADGAQISFEADDKKLTIRSGRSSASLGVLDPKDFPAWDRKADGWEIKLPGSKLSDMIDRTVDAVADGKDTRPYLTGLHIGSKTGALIVAAANGNSVIYLQTEAEIGDNKPVILLPETANAIAKIAEGEITLRVSDALIEAETEAFTLKAKLIEGECDLAKVIPSKAKTPILVERTVLLAAVDRMAKLATAEGKDQSRAVTIEFAGNSAKLRSMFADGAADDEVEAKNPGEPVQVRFIGSLLATALRAFSSDTVELHYADPMGPWLLSDGGDNRAVVAPRR